MLGDFFKTIKERSRTILKNSFINYHIFRKKAPEYIFLLKLMDITYFYLQWITVIQVLFYNLDWGPLSNQLILYELFHLSVCLLRLSLQCLRFPSLILQLHFLVLRMLVLVMWCLSAFRFSFTQPSELFSCRMQSMIHINFDMLELSFLFRLWLLLKGILFLRNL
jgi:hypothetical protein